MENCGMGWNSVGRHHRKKLWEDGERKGQMHNRSVSYTETTDRGVDKAEGKACCMDNGKWKSQSGLWLVAIPRRAERLGSDNPLDSVPFVVLHISSIIDWPGENLHGQPVAGCVCLHLHPPLWDVLCGTRGCWLGAPNVAHSCRAAYWALRVRETLLQCVHPGTAFSTLCLLENAASLEGLWGKVVIGSEGQWLSEEGQRKTQSRKVKILRRWET